MKIKQSAYSSTFVHKNNMVFFSLFLKKNVSLQGFYQNN
ncbi:hypothetical protein HMPREF1154_0948 [Capnocytophaga sp. CM59]|nr:hypothetical protein HMPREF1154_0948 [Capnocytophaga sp. CM59]